MYEKTKGEKSKKEESQQDKKKKQRPLIINTFIMMRTEKMLLPHSKYSTGVYEYACAYCICSLLFHVIIIAN